MEEEAGAVWALLEVRVEDIGEVCVWTGRKLEGKEVNG